MSKRIYPLITVTLVIALICFHFLTSPAPSYAKADPLPSWNDGKVKQAITEFVTRVTTKGSPDFVPVADRIATFDNDGTLWAEEPLVQVMFVRDRLKNMAVANPALGQKQPYKAVLEGDAAFFKQPGAEEAVQEVMALTHANMTQSQFELEVQQFFRTGIHPTLKVPYTRTHYQPMVELLEYLRANQFETWICSGGGIDFIRGISQQIYGIPPQQVIGSNGKKGFIEKEGKYVLWRKPEIERINDKSGKPIGIDLHIGKPPIFAAGNVRSGGDIQMLTYSQQRPGKSFQLLINHDDAQREFAYQEADNASLNAAQANSWNVVSMKKDWKVIFFQ